MHTILVDLPCTIKGFVILAEDDHYTIVLNAKHTHEANVETYFHELEHIKLDDLHSVLKADVLEGLRHK